jgi:NADH:ubiquinone oxidoreductase subunit F (NADH-binding)
VSGAVLAPGVFETAMGTPIVDILGRAGVTDGLSAVLVGGYGGAWLDGGQLDLPYAPGPLAAAGATHGVGILVALSPASCGIAETARVVRYLAGEGAGQCGPCVFGLPALADELEALWRGAAGPEVLARLEELAAGIDGRGACRHPDGAVRLVRSALTVFGADARAHARGRPCAGHRVPTVLRFPSRQPLSAGPS